MAKKKVAKKKVTHSRRRKVGAINSDIMQPLAILGGVVAGRLLTKVMPASISAKTQPIIVAAAGIAGFMFLKNETAKNVAGGIFAVGGLSLIQSMGVLNGLTDSGQNAYTVGAQNRQYRLPYNNQRRVNGQYNRNVNVQSAANMTPLVVGSF